MNKSDLRYQKTEELIIRSFLDCASETEFERIRIKDICARANISRNAFYAHYADKFELLESVCSSLKERIEEGLTPAILSMMSRGSLNESTGWCINKVYENREILAILSRCSEHRLRELLQSVFIEGTLKALYENIAVIYDEPMLYMATAAVSNLLTGSILVWLNNLDKISREEMITFVQTYMHEPCVILYRQIAEHTQMRPYI